MSGYSSHAKMPNWEVPMIRSIKQLLHRFSGWLNRLSHPSEARKNHWNQHGGKVAKIPPSTAGGVEANGTLTDVAQIIDCDNIGGGGAIRSPIADITTIPGTGTVMLDLAEPPVSTNSALDAGGLSVNSPASGSKSHASSTAISEEELRRAVWRGCHDADSGTASSSEIGAARRWGARRKRHRRRYSFPRRGVREKQERLWRRLFPWNRFRSHL